MQRFNLEPPRTVRETMHAVTEASRRPASRKRLIFLARSFNVARTQFLEKRKLRPNLLLLAFFHHQRVFKINYVRKLGFSPYTMDIRNIRRLSFL